MKKFFLILFLTGILCPVTHAQLFPVRPDTVSLLYDFADFFKSPEEVKLQQMQQHYRDKTQADIWIITVTSMGDRNSSTYTYQLAERWNLNPRKKQILMVIKPKYPEEKGEIFIATSYGGLDRKISDEEVKSIIDDYIIPKFKKGKPYQGVKAGVKEIMGRIFE
jgi:uncharacterized protein